MNKLKPKTQVIYIPDHANGDTHHQDCEEGFVVEDLGENVRCRFYYRNRTGLRTTANSETCSKMNLLVRNHRSPETIAGDWNAYVEGGR